LYTINGTGRDGLRGYAVGLGPLTSVARLGGGGIVVANVLINPNRPPITIPHIFEIMGTSFYVRGGNKMLRDNPENWHPASLCNELD